MDTSWTLVSQSPLDCGPVQVHKDKYGRMTWSWQKNSGALEFHYSSLPESSLLDVSVSAL